MTADLGHPETHDRRRTMLRTAMGAEIAAALADPAVIEVMVNPDGALAARSAGRGPDRHRRAAGRVRGRAHHPAGRLACPVGSPCRQSRSSAPNCRRPASASKDCCRRCRRRRAFRSASPRHASTRSTIMSPTASCLPPQADIAAHAPSPTARNILIAGGTSSGKTTLANALLAEIADAR